MNVVYEGPSTSVEVVELGWQVVERGVAVEVPDDLGARLCQQIGNWREATPDKKKAGN